jgi:hypothetical protein
MLRLARAVEGINSCLVRKGSVIPEKPRFGRGLRYSVKAPVSSNCPFRFDENAACRDLDLASDSAVYVIMVRYLGIDILLIA